MTPREYLRLLRRRWLVVALAAAIGLAAGALVNGPSGGGRQRYQATTLLLQRPVAPDEATARPGLLAEVETVTTLLTVGEVPRRVAEAIEYEGTESELVARVRTGGDRTTGLIRIAAVALRPERAVEISRAFADELRRYLLEREAEGTQQALNGLDARIKKLEGEIRALRSSTEGSLGRTQLEAKVHSLETLLNERGRLTAVKPDVLVVVGSPVAEAVADEGISIPVGRTRMAILGTLGALLGFGLVLLGSRLDDRVRTREDAEQAFGAPVLAEIPVLAKDEREHVIASADRHSPAADAFGLLAYAIQRRTSAAETIDLENDRSGPLLVTSTTHGEGKTLVAVNLAAALAETGKNVLLISADFRSSTVSTTFDVPAVPGLSDALRDADLGRPTLASVLRETSIPGLQVVTSGSMPERLSEMLSSQAMRRALREARLRSDHVIIDAAPILAARDAALLLNDVGSVLLVAGAGKVTTDLADRARDLLEQVGAPLIGVVLNGSEDAPVPRAGRLGQSARRRIAGSARRRIARGGPPLLAPDGDAAPPPGAEPAHANGNGAAASRNGAPVVDAPDEPITDTR